MAEKESDEASATATPTASATPAAAGPSLFTLANLFYLLNSLTLLGVLGFMVYTKIVYKKAKLTEATEAERLDALLNSKSDKFKAVQSGHVPFGPFTINILPTPQQPQAGDGTNKQLMGKLHYVTLSFAFEIRDTSNQDLVEQIRTPLLDRLVTSLGKKSFHEMASVQGRYILASELLSISNRLIREIPAEKPAKQDLITNVYFTEFIVQ